MNNVMYYLQQSAEKFGDKVAVIDEDRQCTYQGLRHISCNVAAYLMNRNIKNRPVIVFMDKGLDTLYAFFGIAYSQNYYSLLNPDLPEHRLKQIKTIIETPYIITNRQLLSRVVSLFPDTCVYLVEEMIEDQIYDQRAFNHVFQSTLDINPLYINFTSGSTGKPKGVVISHQSTIDFIDEFTKKMNISKQDRIGNQAPFDFDVSVKDIYSCLKTGATLVIIPKRLFSRPTKLIEYICDHEVTTLIWAVSALSLIYTFHGLQYKVPHLIKKVMFSGEVMPLKHLQAWQQALPEAQFINLYGPTEITCNCLYHILDKNRDYSDGIPVGKAFKNEEVFLLDENDRLIIEKHRQGEICVRGRTLALGYYNNEEETNRRFVQNPLHHYYPDVIYRTGDLGYLNERGEMVFCGRKDFQIKYQGHRIELEEIEKSALTIDEIKQCCCMFDHEKQKFYFFYIGEIEKPELVARLKKILPAYMIPGRICRLDVMPLTKNGKIDRQLLLSQVTGGKKNG